MANTTVSLFPLFLGSLGVTVDGTIIVNELGVAVTAELDAAVEGTLLVEDISELLVPTDASNITVEVEEEHNAEIEVCS